MLGISLCAVFKVLMTTTRCLFNSKAWAYSNQPYVRRAWGGAVLTVKIEQSPGAERYNPYWPTFLKCIGVFGQFAAELGLQGHPTLARVTLARMGCSPLDARR